MNHVPKENQLVAGLLFLNGEQLESKALNFGATIGKPTDISQCDGGQWQLIFNING